MTAPIKAQSTKSKRDRDLLRLLGLNVRKLSAADVAEGAELARRITQCERVPGANKRRGKAIADWRTFAERRRPATGDAS